MDPSVALISKIRARSRLQRNEFGGKSGGFTKAPPLSPSQRKHHHASSIAGGEIPTERAVHVIAEPAARLRLENCFADQAEVPGDCKPHIRQAQLDQLPFTVDAAMSLSGEDCEPGEKSRHAVPRGQDVIDRTIMALRSDEPRKAERRVD